MKTMAPIPLLLFTTWCCGTPVLAPEARTVSGAAEMALPLAASSGKMYGPATVHFDLTVHGSPYDARVNDVRVVFQSGANHYERMAYFDGTRWAAVLASPAPGTYMAKILLNGEPVRSLSESVKLTAATAHDFVRVAEDGRSLVGDGGNRYWPIGHNLGWQGGPGLPSIPDALRRMASDGLNWARIWSCTWDGKNPWWPNAGTQNRLGDLWQPALKQWDAIADAATESGVRYQWVLFHHGMVSADVDPNWKDNPWNAANGGFLAKPEDFFTDPRAKQLAKNYLRYVVARYGHQTGILGWELFNEVENTTAARSDHWRDIEAWHKEMADYLRSIDPYRHPIITSSAQRPGLAAAVDLCEPHGYPADVGALVAGAPINKTQPFFFGEVGLGKPNPSEQEQRKTIRDAIWGAFMAGHSGAAQYWYWDVVQRQHLDDEFAFGVKTLRDLRLSPGPEVTPTKVNIEGEGGGDLVLRPGISWGASTKRKFVFPEDAGPAAAGSMSSFLQGVGHADMGSSFTFKVQSGKPGSLKLHLGTQARSGARLIVAVDGASVLDQSFAPTDADTVIDSERAVPFSAGDHTIEVRNDGPDWLTIDAYTFMGMGRSVEAIAARDGDKVVIRLQKASDRPSRYRFKVAELPDGSHKAFFVDLVSKTVRAKNLTSLDGWISPAEPMATFDALWVVEQK